MNKRNDIFLSMIIALVFCLINISHAQLGSGWEETDYAKRIHLDDEAGLQTFTWTTFKSVGSGSPCADYRYDSSTETHTFNLYDNRTNRSEIRLENEYRTGRRQFEGYVTFYPPLNDECLFQIFGNSGGGATYAMMRGYSANGGEIRVMSPARTIASRIYSVEVKINMIHNQNAWTKWYVNGKLMLTKGESDTRADNYWKYGCYGTLRTNGAKVTWRKIRTFKDGYAPDEITEAGHPRQGSAVPSRSPAFGVRLLMERHGSCSVVIFAPSSNGRPGLYSLRGAFIRQLP